MLEKARMKIKLTLNHKIYGLRPSSYVKKLTNINQILRLGDTI